MEDVMLMMSYLQKYLFPVKKDVNIKVFNMMTRIHEAKTLVKHISCNCECKFIITTFNSNKKWNNDE